MRKSQTTTFLLLLFYIRKLVLLENIFGKTYLYLYCYNLHYCFFTWQVIVNAVIPTSILIFLDIYGFVDAIIRSKILGHRLGTLT